MSKTGHATKNRQVRQEELRNLLREQGHLQHVVKIIGELSDKKETLSPAMVDRYKIAMNARLKLMAKYIPDLKAVEVTSEGGEPLSIQLTMYASPKDIEALGADLKQTKQNDQEFKE